MSTSRKTRKHILARAAAIMALLTVGLTSANAASFTWDGDSDLLWDTPANWVGDSAPAFDGTDDIIFGEVANDGDVTDTNGDRNINSMNLTGVNGKNFEITGGKLTLQSGNVSRGSNVVNTMTVSADLELGSDGTWNFSPGNGSVQEFSGVISDGGNGYGISLNTNRGVTFSGDNTFDGDLSVTGSTLVISGDNSARDGDTIVSSGGALQPTTNTAFGTGTVKVYGARITSLGTSHTNDLELYGPVFDKYGVSSAVTFSGTTTLFADINMVGQNTGSFLVLEGPVVESGGSYGFTSTSSGNLSINAASSLTGDLVWGGNNTTTLNLGASGAGGYGNVILDTNGGNINLSLNDQDALINNNKLTLDASSGQRIFLGFNSDNLVHSVNAIELGGIMRVNGGDGGNGDRLILDGPATLLADTTVYAGPQSNAFRLTGDITGNFAIIKDQQYDSSRTGSIELLGNNSFTGGVSINRGTLGIGSDTALGTGTLSLLDLNGAAIGLVSYGDYTLANDVVIENSFDLTTASSSLTFTGSNTINNSYGIEVSLDGGVLDFVNGISEVGAGTYTIDKTGDGVLRLGASSYDTLTIAAGGGAVIATGNDAFGTNLALLVAPNGTTLGFDGGVNYASAKAIQVHGAGDDGTAGALQSISGNNSFAGPITLNASANVNVEADRLVLSGSITENAASTLTKLGSGLLVINGTASHTGGTDVNVGDLRVGGSVGNVNLASGTSLTVVGAGTTGDVVATDALVTINNTSGTGTGSVTANSATNVFGTGDIGGDLNLNGTSSINPGNSAGVLNVAGNLTFAGSGNNYNLEILALTIGYAFDQIIVGGDVDLNSAFLNVTLTTPVEKWQKLFIVVNNGGNAVGDTFIGLPQGQLFDMGGGNFARISYFGDSGSGEVTGGNDIVLYDFNTSIPEPATMSLLVLGGLFMNRRHRRA